ncbi:MAG: TonB-dependent receptor, partial [Acidobacteria bacterium]|nr:TonB-dependent receptor [Acidobacteriota bacterium]
GDGARGANGSSMNLANTTGPGGSNLSIYQVENQVNISANGQRISSNGYWVDGVSVNSQSWGGAAVLTPSADDVKELHVVSTPYDASLGRNSGAIVEVVTQSGTNSIHGGAFFNYQDPSLNAFSGYAGPAGAKPTKDANKWRQYGAHAGGPIKKDKLFWFFDWEGLHSSSTTVSGPMYTFTPQFLSALHTQRGGSFADTVMNLAGAQPAVYSTLTPSCAPFTSANWACAVVNGGLDVGSPYQGNGAYVPIFGGNAATCGTNQQCQAGGGLDGVPDLQYVQLRQQNLTKPNQYNGRLDYNLSSKHQLAWTGMFVRGNSLGPADGSVPAPAFNLAYTPNNSASMLAWIWTLSPSMLNDARVNFTRWAYNELSSSSVNWGIPYVYVQNMPGGVGNINVSPTSSPTTPADLAENTYEFVDTFTKVFGRHAIRFGGEYTREQNNDNEVGRNRPAYAFADLWNLFNNAPIYEGVLVNPKTGADSTSRFYYRSHDLGLFVQDDIKLRPNLTANVGLRYEYFSPISEVNGHLTNFIPGSSGLTNGTVNVVSQYYNASKTPFSPRVGFAWSPGEQTKLVVRGGFGIAYNRVPEALLTNSRQNPPFAAQMGLCCGTAGYGGESWGSPFDNNLILLSTSSNGIYGYQTSPTLPTLMPLGANNLPSAGAQFGSVEIWGAPQHFPQPMSMLYSLQVQDQLPFHLVGSVAYQGSETRHEIRIVNQNFVYPAINNAVYAMYFPTPDVSGNFNALLADVQRNFNDWTFTANYRWSKSLDTLSYSGPGFVTNQTYPQNNALNYGPSDYDAKHYFNVFSVYHIPLFKHTHGVENFLLGGWTTSGIFTYHTGFPWTPVTYQSCLPVASQCLSPYRPSGVLKTPVYSNSYSALTTAGSNFPGGGAAYFNQAPGIPAIGRNSFRGPNYRSVDLTMGKTFKIMERASLDVRGVAYNVFNLTNLAPFQFGAGNTNIGSATFGQATNSTAGRVMQVEARINF